MSCDITDFNTKVGNIIGTLTTTTTTTTTTAEEFVDDLIKILDNNTLNDSLTYFNFKSFPACNLSYKQTYNPSDNTIIAGCANVIDNYKCSDPTNQKIIQNKLVDLQTAIDTQIDNFINNKITNLMNKSDDDDVNKTKQYLLDTISNINDTQYIGGNENNYLKYKKSISHHRRYVWRERVFFAVQIIVFFLFFILMASTLKKTDTTLNSIKNNTSQSSSSIKSKSSSMYNNLKGNIDSKKQYLEQKIPKAVPTTTLKSTKKNTSKPANNSSNNSSKTANNSKSANNSSKT